MLDFDEEIKRFTPSADIDKTEENIMDGKNLDVCDILEALTEERRKR